MPKLESFRTIFVVESNGGECTRGQIEVRGAIPERDSFLLDLRDPRPISERKVMVRLILRRGDGTQMGMCSVDADDARAMASALVRAAREADIATAVCRHIATHEIAKRP